MALWFYYKDGEELDRMVHLAHWPDDLSVTDALATSRVVSY
jgi:hypothetical protein